MRNSPRHPVGAQTYTCGMAPDRLVAIALAALELLPGDSSDLTPILEDPEQRQALLTGGHLVAGSDLLAYLVEAVDLGRVDVWGKQVDALRRDAAGIPVLAGDPEYPARLRSCWDRPPLFFYLGQMAHDGPALGIVGSRTADPEVRECARTVAYAAADRGVTVVSGLAAGVDTAAHEGALSAGGHTVAVLGTGIRRVFPQENKPLAFRISQTGALLSQFAPDAPRTSSTFLLRNHVIAGLADVSLVMDGQPRSGSRHQAEQAVRYGRQVLLWRPTLGGQPWAQETNDSGAGLFVDSVDEVLAALTWAS